MFCVVNSAAVMTQVSLHYELPRCHTVRQTEKFARLCRAAWNCLAPLAHLPLTQPGLLSFSCYPQPSPALDVAWLGRLGPA